MKHGMTLLMGVLALLAFGMVRAQNVVQSVAPSTEQMIEQLKSSAPITPATTPTGTPTIKTRSLRNLSVRVAPGQDEPGAAATTDPSAPAISSLTPLPDAPSLSLLIQFDFDSATVKTQSQAALENLAQALQSKALEASRFAIEGHTDAKGQADYNRHLSQLRADAVRDFLAHRGVPTQRLLASGKGASELATPAQPYSAQNRRVRIVNLD